MRQKGGIMASGERAGRVKSAEAVARQTVAAGTATEMQVLIGPDDGAPNFAMRRFIMGEGGGMPLHTNEVEHEQYVLAGRAQIGIGDRTVEVETGDVIFIPARQPHFYKVLEAPFEFLCLVPVGEDQIRLIENREKDPAA
jgi:quercetin dioxygenase-like cupin family protein